MQNLNIRYPSLYTTNKCCKCSLIEDTLHILLCSKNMETIQQSLINITNNTLHQLQLNIPSTILLNSLLLITTNSPNIQPDLLLPTILGIFSKSIYQNIKTLLNKQTELFLINFSNNLLNWFYQEIWFKQNSFQHQWEMARNITQKTKCSKLTLPLTNNYTNTHTSHSRLINPHNAIEKWYLQGFSLLTCFL